MRRKTIIMGAAGRDFHNFNTFFRKNKEYKVIAFTATQIPDIAGRKYPRELSGSLYPKGIPIYPESKLEELIRKFDIDTVVFSYSDVPHEYVMHKASLALSCGTDFMLLGPKSTMLKSKKKVIAVGAVRTGCGKSQTTRRVSKILKELGKKVVVIRHPMPYGDLTKQIVQRFETYEDLKKAKCTIEEREEYEPHIKMGVVVYAGVDYEKILAQAEKEADIILWDGGNNDFPFYEPDLFIVVADPLRPGHEVSYYPGETNFRMADIIVINKVDSAKKEAILIIRENIKKFNPEATIIEAESPVICDNPEVIKGKRVLVIEDGPTLTHGGMKYGAGIVAAKKFGARELVDPRNYTVGSIRETFRKYPEIGALLPAMGYGEKQMKELEETIRRTPSDSVVIATPIDLGKIISIKRPFTKISYELKEVGKPSLENYLQEFVNV